jgi:Ca2+-transporting ATPase
MTMTIFALSGAILVVIIGIFRGFRDPNNDENAAWLQSVLLAISMAVSAIPEGLPLVVTICLALGTSAMAKNNALIRRLPAVETLGSASVICSDKTGTLTSGKMTLTKAWAAGKTYTVSGEGYDPTRGCVADAEGGSVDSLSADAALAASMHVANLCNEATVKCVEGRWKSIGTSTESALVVGTEKFGLKTLANRQSHKRLLNVPFSSTFKMMATVHEVAPSTEQLFAPDLNTGCTGPLVVLAKGAPFSILSLCSSSRVDGADGVVPMTPELASQIEKEVDVLSSSGLRVLAMCYRRIPELPAAIEQDTDGLLSSEEKLRLCVSDMVFCGLLGMMDPPRSGVRAAVKRAKKGGVRTVMITGDYLKTAVAIAEMVHILEPTMDEAESAVDCSLLRPGGSYLSHHELDAVTWHTFVFARAKPEDKLQIVKSFQRQGFVCAMTGDVNYYYQLYYWFILYFYFF